MHKQREDGLSQNGCGRNSVVVVGEGGRERERGEGGACVRACVRVWGGRRRGQEGGGRRGGREGWRWVWEGREAREGVRVEGGPGGLSGPGGGGRSGGFALFPLSGPLFFHTFFSGFEGGGSRAGEDVQGRVVRGWEVWGMGGRRVGGLGAWWSREGEAQGSGSKQRGLSNKIGQKIIWPGLESSWSVWLLAFQKIGLSNHIFDQITKTKFFQKNQKMNILENKIFNTVYRKIKLN